jgi:hypothetical protein
MRFVKYQRPDLWNWSPLDQLSSLRDEINRLFETPLENRIGQVLFALAALTTLVLLIQGLRSQAA